MVRHGEKVFDLQRNQLKAKTRASARVVLGKSAVCDQRVSRE